MVSFHRVLKVTVVNSYTAGLAIGITSTIVIDMAFCLQGNELNELPEILLGCCRFSHVDIRCAKKFKSS